MATLETVSYLKLSHTPGHRGYCPACANGGRLEERELSPAITFREAFAAWIDRRVIEKQNYFTKVRYVSKRTEKDLRQYARAAGKFFDELRLEEIHRGHLREYQKARALNLLLESDQEGEARERHPWHEQAGAKLIRKEVQTVLRVLRAAGLWTEEDDKALDLVEADEQDVPRALTPHEQQLWLTTASRRIEWRLVYLWSIVAFQTTMATNEMRALRLGDIDLDQGLLQVRSEGAKNRFRIRSIPLQTREIVFALRELIERARGMGARSPFHYLFPLHITGERYDAEQPFTVWGMRKPWDAVKAATGFDGEGGRPNFTPYCTRHTSITRMAEAGVPIPVIMSYAGHISPRMQQHYTQVSMQAKRRWAAAAFAGAEMPYMPQFGYGAGLELPTAAGSGFVHPAGTLPIGGELEQPPAPKIRKRA